jgi:acetyltransferase-like isoleucine patch superfamily enzyme
MSNNALLTLFKPIETMLTQEEMQRMGFASLGENIQISNRASIYGASRISLGNNVRIDDFCILSAGVGGIRIGEHVHIAVYSSLIGSGMITLSDFCNLSSRVSVYSSNDDYSGTMMTNPTVPEEYTGVSSADVFLAKHVIVGSGSVILPGVTLAEGVAVGALSLVNTSCAAFGIYAGVPAMRVKERRNDLLELERQFLAAKLLTRDRRPP